MLLKQQQQQQGLVNRTATMHTEQHNVRPSMLSGIPTTFNSSQQYSQKSATPITTSANNTMGTPVGVSGVGGSNLPQRQQQMLMFQQQMSALQKQQQMSGPGGSSAAANAMVAMQQFSADGNNSLYAPQLPNRNTALSSNLQSGTLQQQQQQSQHLLARQQHSTK